jgi:hypothetical protein
MKSNWMRGNTAPIVFRVASGGKAMTRTEKVRDIVFQKSLRGAAALRKEMVLKARAETSDKRDYAVVKAQLNNPDAKVKLCKNGSVIGRVNGAFVALAK